MEKVISQGNYEQAISKALKKLENNKDKKRKQDYIVMLKDAYYKILDKDLITINHLKKDGNPELFEDILDIYLDLEARQNAIKAVMPLKINNKPLKLQFKDYATLIATYRTKVSEYKYNSALALMDSYNKLDFRDAYQIFASIEVINPNYKSVRSLMKTAHQKGTHHVLVSIKNNTNQVIPRQLEDDLLDFDTYGLNHFWTVYHANPSDNLDYDFSMELQLQQILVSPEQVNSRQLLREKDIVDGWEYVLDDNGNVAKDSLGNDIKIDKITTIKAEFFKVQQIKSTRVFSKVEFFDTQTHTRIDTFPIESEFVFENHYATFRGDRRALKDKDKDLLNNKALLFPSNEQMAFETGEDIKQQLKEIISSYHL
ncbi:MAG: hypothetical protein HRT67_06425 [Flavobacteriaceae bacterium]|nr:hypothetical protein [Flavobacteriaceae bacterium]